MSNLHTTSHSHHGSVFLPEEGSAPSRRFSVTARDIWVVLRRHWLLIGVCGAVLAGLATGYVLQVSPVYWAGASLRLEDKQPNLPDVFRTLSTGSELVTEMEVLKSRSLAEDVVSRLALQVRLIEPRNTVRSSALSGIMVSQSASPAEFILDRQANGQYLAYDVKASTGPRVVTPGKPASVGGVQFILVPSTSHIPRIRFRVERFDLAVQDLREAITVGQATRDAKIVMVGYEDTDREIVWQVPNLLVNRFLERRAEKKSGEAGGAVTFLQRQLDTLAKQLGSAENELRLFREREHVVAPDVEASSQVNRLVTLQSERTELEAERGALAQLMAEVDATARTRRDGEGSPYRRLLAFPSLLRNDATSQLLRLLAEVEDERSKLLGRRTVKDPDVHVLDARVAHVEEQLRSMAGAYLQGLSQQVAGLNLALGQYQAELARLPGRELTYARLDRQPKILSEMYALIQTRLKEAEIAQAARDPSIQVVDQATQPMKPVRPRRRLFVLAFLAVGLSIGTAFAFGREFLDRAVRTRADISTFTGLPVLALIPSIGHLGKGVALITEKRKHRPPVQNEIKPDQPGLSISRNRYTFLNGAAPAEPEEVPPRPEPAKRAASVGISEVGNVAAEAYASLYTHVAHCHLGASLKVLLVSSALPGDGKTTTAVNLALSLTRRGLRVLLIDADMRRGVVHSLFGVARAPGLSEVLQRQQGLRETCHPVEVERGQELHFLTQGGMPPSALGLLGSPAMAALLEAVRGEYDLIVLDSPPVNVITDAVVLGSQADGIILVARSGVTETRALQYAMEQLRHVREKVIGVVLNDIDFSRDASYDSSYQYVRYDQYLSGSAK